jgi:hypothetical protein
MIYNVLIAFRDKYTKERYAAGSVAEFSEERAAEILSVLGDGWIEAVGASAPFPVPAGTLNQTQRANARLHEDGGVGADGDPPVVPDAAGNGGTPRAASPTDEELLTAEGPNGGKTKKARKSGGAAGGGAELS